MTYNAAIEKLTQALRSGTDEPFIVYRDRGGGWHCGYTQNKHGEEFGWVSGAKATDPCAAVFAGSDFDSGSYAAAYNKVMTERLRMEYGAEPTSGMGKRDAAALMKFLDDHFCELSPEASGYIANHDKPFAAVGKTIPFSLFSYDQDYGYSTEKGHEAIGIIEKKARDMAACAAGEPSRANADKRSIYGYEEKLGIRLAGIHVSFAENPAAEEPYLVCSARRDNPLGIEESYGGYMSGDYLMAMREFTRRVEALIGTLEKERSESGLPQRTLTASDCADGKRAADWEGRLIVIKAGALAPEYRNAEHQLAICTGGFGSREGARGSAVYAQELHSGKKCRYDRHEIEGLADMRKIPRWAAEKMHGRAKSGDTVIGAEKAKKNEAPREQAQPAKKKPTLQERLGDARMKVAEDNARKSGRCEKPKKRAAMEVG